SSDCRVYHFTMFSFSSFFIPPPPSSTLFPYTTLFRSGLAGRERFRVRVPDGAHEPQSGARHRDGVPRPGLRSYLPELEPRARSGALRRRCFAARPPRGATGAQKKVREVTFRDSVYERARRAGRRIVLPEGSDERVRAAAAQIEAMGLGRV